MGIPDQSKWVGVASVDPPQSIPATVDFEHVNQGQAFICYGWAMAYAARYTYLQLWNPVGSGILAYLTGVTYNTNATAAIRSYITKYDTTALVSLVGNGFNKNLGEAVSLCQLRYETNAALLGATIIATYRNNNHGPEIYPLLPPIRLNEGDGIAVFVLELNINLMGCFEWIEI